ncbi:MAG TPA: alpha/beta fold hydrolase [candidate division Zixibacteria bacterium]|nr:alpha/beta fold hydrolase [candidate division Zixibacteria bacterium]
MHGKGGSPAKYVSSLAAALAQRGYLVANLEMPWSGRRGYDVNVAAAEAEVRAALDALRIRGAKRLFVAGHSQGALFALYFGGRHPVDGVIAIAPGGSVNSAIFREKLGESVDRARRLIAEGKGGEKTGFMDYEGSRGVYPIATSAETFLSWFDPDGAMNLPKAVKAMNPRVPVLYVVPTGDYPALLKAREEMFGYLPANPLTKLHEPDSGHLDAPYAARDEVMRWTAEVASKTGPAVQDVPADVRP